MICFPRVMTPISKKGGLRIKNSIIKNSKSYELVEICVQLNNNPIPSIYVTIWLNFLTGNDSSILVANVNQTHVIFCLVLTLQQLQTYSSLNLLLSCQLLHV